MRKAAIVQSNYIPWRGYFDLISQVDTFILLDDVQFTKRDWRNRNIIKSPSGPKWLTIPVQTKGKYSQKICETKIEDPSWAKTHWDILKDCYKPAPHFSSYANQFEDLYISKAAKEIFLSKVNFLFLKEINQILKIQTEIQWSSQFDTRSEKTERLVDLCKKVRADVYLSGPSARSYLDEKKFEKEEIKVEWMDYSGYKDYPQCHGDFINEVSVLDLIFNLGAESARYFNSR